MVSRILACFIIFASLVVSAPMTAAAQDFSCADVEKISLQECESLLLLRESTSGLPQNWFSSNTPCKWEDIRCSQDGISELELRNLEIHGAIDDMAFVHLQKLVIFGSEVPGGIPDFSGLPNLQYLSISFNELTGEIPDFSGIPKLERLSLVENQLIGKIPDFSALPKLMLLRISYNQLSGEIPDFSGLPELIKLDLFKNNLSGRVPEFAGTPKLVTLWLAENYLFGEIPDFSALTSLEELSLADNQLSGPVPDFSGLPNLEMAYLELNQLSGKVPDYVYQVDIYALGGNCDLEFESSDGAPKSMSHFLRKCDEAEESRPLAELIDKHSSQEVDCTGIVGVSQTECESLARFEENIRGLPKDWGRNNTPCEWIGITCTSSGIAKIELVNHKLSGRLVELDLIHLEVLDLAANRISGEVADLSGMPNLKYLALSSNRFSGEVPDVSTLSNLEYLGLSVNNFSGEIPDFSGMANLEYLGISHNSLSGPLPDFSGMSNLKNMDLSFNSLSGEVPEFVNQLKWLKLADNCGLRADASIAAHLNGIDPQWKKPAPYCSLAHQAGATGIPEEGNAQNGGPETGDNPLNLPLPIIAGIASAALVAIATAVIMAKKRKKS